MIFFISCEAQMKASDYILKLRIPILDEFNKRFKNKSYGSDIEVFAIISTCISKAWLANMGWKERNLYKKKDKSTDIRLFMDYEKFISVTDEERKSMYANHIYESIIAFHEKHKKLDFNWEELLNDVKSVIESIDWDHYSWPGSEQNK